MEESAGTENHNRQPTGEQGQPDPPALPPEPSPYFRRCTTCSRPIERKYAYLDGRCFRCANITRKAGYRNPVRRTLR